MLWKWTYRCDGLGLSPWLYHRLFKLPSYLLWKKGRGKSKIVWKTRQISILWHVQVIFWCFLNASSQSGFVWMFYTAPDTEDRKPGFKKRKHHKLYIKSVFEAPGNLTTIPVEGKDLGYMRYMPVMCSLNKTTETLTWLQRPGVSTPPRGQSCVWV